MILWKLSCFCYEGLAYWIFYHFSEFPEFGTPSTHWKLQIIQFNVFVTLVRTDFVYLFFNYLSLTFYGRVGSCMSIFDVKSLNRFDSGSWESRAVPFTFSVHQFFVWGLLYPYGFEHLSFCWIVSGPVVHFHFEALFFTSVSECAVFPQCWPFSFPSVVF